MDRTYLNDGWKYYGAWESKMAEADFDDSSFEEVRIPHTVTVTPYDYFDASIYQKVSCYRKSFTLDEEHRDKRVLLTVDGAAHEAELFVNGYSCTIHRCGYTAFTEDITDRLKHDAGAVNNIAIRLDSRESLNIPPFGNVIDYMTYGGIYRSIYIDYKNTDMLDDVFVTSSSEGTGAGARKVKTDVGLRVHSDGRYEIRQSIMNGDGRIVKKNSVEWIPFNLNSNEQTVHTEFTADGVNLWSPEQPAVYSMLTELVHDGKVADSKTVHFGFRDVEFRAEGFFLNGSKVKLRGLNRHQSFPYIGYAMPDRLQKEDAVILKEELGVNAVRCSHYPQSQSFIDKCDETGLLVFMEFPGWQHIGDDAWKEQACENLREMIVQYRNHPSIFIWGVRINESQDDDEFYQRTNKEAHELDPSRPTGGVRFLQKSHLLEDVYTYNDFLHNGKNDGVSPKKDITPDMHRGYLISEYNGHMYPTKAFDDEAHRTEHARRHMRVLNDVMKNQDIAGSFGWCMFDYNTHKDFGSGDRICYHGVMDMFRNPKMAAYVYASQTDSKDVFEVSSTMDIGEYPGGHLAKVYAFTNADSVKLYKGDEFVKEFFPDTEEYPYMHHPPVIIDDFIGCLIEHHEKYTHAQAEAIKEALRGFAEFGMNGMPLRLRLKLLRLMIVDHLTVAEGTRLYSEYLANWGEKALVYRFEAIKNGNVIKEIIKTPVTSHHLEMTVGTDGKKDVYGLEEGITYDAESVRLRMTDQNGNLLPYFNEPVSFSCSGSIELIGPKTTSLRGGTGGTYIRTNGQAGEGILTICCQDEEEEIHFNVSKAGI